MLVARHQPPAPARGALPPCARRAGSGATARADRRSPSVPRYARGRPGRGDHAPRPRCGARRHRARGDRKGPRLPRLQPARRAAARAQRERGAMQPDLNRVTEQVSKEKGIDRGIIVKALEEAMLSAAKKTFGHEKNIEAKFNTELGEVELFEIKTVVEHVEDPETQVTLEVAHAKIDPEAEVGDELLAKLPPQKCGRIAAQAAKQHIIQRVRDAERDIDPVGACVGMRGTRVQAVVQELRGEKIDIAPWTSDPAEYVCRALAPAKVSKIIMDEDEHAMEVIVPDDQLALAIGKKGQNVRLASRLTGWKLDVRSEAEAEDEARRARSSLTAIPNVGDVTAELLYQSGFKSAEELAASDEETVGEIEGIGPERAGGLLAAAREHVQRVREQEAVAAAEAAAAAALAAAGSGEASAAAPAEPV